MGESIHYQSFVPFLDDRAFTFVLMMFIAYAIVFVILFLGTRNKKLRPGKAQNLVEWAVTYVTDYADTIIGKKEAPRFYPLLVMLFFYILVGNLMGLIPGLISPTSTLSVTAALGAMVFVYEWVSGIAKKGPIKYFAHYFGPPGIPTPIKPFLFIIELLSDFARPVSLTFRLFGNIVAKEILLGVLIVLVILLGPAFTTDGISAFLASFAFILRPLIIILGVLVSVIQAGVFTLLTAIYIGGAVAAHDHAEEHEAH